jgi:hypothetical protein
MMGGTEFSRNAAAAAGGVLGGGGGDVTVGAWDQWDEEGGVGCSCWLSTREEGGAWW